MYSGVEVFESKKDNITKMKWKDLEDRMDKDLRKKQEKRKRWNLKQARKFRKRGY